MADVFASDGRTVVEPTVRARSSPSSLGVEETLIPVSSEPKSPTFRPTGSSIVRYGPTIGWYTD